MPSLSPSSSAVEPGTNPRGIPSFPFMTSITSYVSSPADVEPTLRRFQEMIAKYQFMEANVSKRAGGLREKLPEMESTLSTIRFLRKKKDQTRDEEDVGDEGVADLETTFSLSDTLYAKAKFAPKKIDEVYLWLGANVMVAYPLAEAEEMLRGKVEKARETLKSCEEDMEFLRVQITTVEVAIARVYNWDVVEKRKRKEKGSEIEGSAGKEEEDGEKEEG
jgi:prefoldin subunit 5